MNKIEEITEETPTNQVSQNQDFVLSIENCTSFLVNLLEHDCKSSFTLEEAEIVNRAVRFFKGLKQLHPDLENKMTKENYYEVLFSACQVAQGRKGFSSLDVSSLVLYSINFLRKELDLKKPETEQEKKMEESPAKVI
jgi:hypothetical protein